MPSRDPQAVLVQLLRGDTPALIPNHGNEARALIHFNNAGASLMPGPVEQTLIKYLQHENMVGSYEAQWDNKEALLEVYDSVGKLVGAKSAEDARFEVAIMGSATAAWCAFFYSVKLEAGDEILTCRADYGANIVAMQQRCRRTGAKIRVVPDSAATGATDPEALKKMLAADKDKGKIKIVHLVHIPTCSGLTNPVEEIGAVVHEHNNSNNNAPANNNNRVLYFVDGCQTAGQYPIDVHGCHIDAFSAASRKYLRGPRGVGFLWVRREVLESPTLLGEPATIDHFAAPWTRNDDAASSFKNVQDDPTAFNTNVYGYKVRRDCRRFETWENAPALRLAMGRAIEYALRLDVHWIWKRVQFLGNYLREQLTTKLAGSVVVMDVGKVLCGIVAFMSTPESGVTCAEIQRFLRDRGVNVTISTTAVTRMMMDKTGAECFVRASLHYYNRLEEIDIVVALLKERIEMGRLAKL